MAQKNELIELFSPQWEEKCREALRKVSVIENKKIPETEKWWRIKQLLQELARPERRRRPRPPRPETDVILESPKVRERCKVDLRSQEWMEKCAEMHRKCVEMENEKVSEKEKLWRVRQLIKELASVDQKRGKSNR